MSFVAYEKSNGLVGLQEREESYSDLPEYLYVKDTAFRKTEEFRDLQGKKALIYVEIE